MVGSQAAAGSNRDLFGGAITAFIPPAFADISKIREVPDNQEVFSHAETDRSIIIELLQLEDPLPSPHTIPATLHYANLARDAGAVSSTVAHAAPIPSAEFPLLTEGDGAASVSIVYGTHDVSKYRDAAHLANRVNITLACVRLPRATTDLLLVFNDPVALHPDSASTRLGSAVAAPKITDMRARAAPLHDALRSLQVKDWGLFC